jgi:hypothetical protein
VCCAENIEKIIYGMTTHSYISKNKNAPAYPSHSFAAGHNKLNAFVDAVFGMSGTESKLMILSVIENRTMEVIFHSATFLSCPKLI